MTFFNGLKMKLFGGYHLYSRLGSDGLPVIKEQRSDTGEPARPGDTLSPTTGTVASDLDLIAQQSRNHRVKFGILLTKGKYRPPQAPVSAPPQSIRSSIQPTEQITSVAIQHAEQSTDATIQHAGQSIDATVQHTDQSIDATVQHTDQSIDASVAHVDIHQAGASSNNTPAALSHSPAPLTPIAVPTPTRKFMDIPPEIHRQIIKLAGVEDIKRFRLVSKYAADIGAAALRHLIASDPHSFKEALKRFGNEGGIESLTLSGNFLDLHFSRLTVQRLMQSALRGLEIFDPSSCDSLTPFGIKHVVQHTPLLKELDLSGQTVSARLIASRLNLILESLPQLRKLNLSGATSLTNQPQNLANALALVPQLTHLNVSNLNELTDGGLHHALENVPNLTHLHLKACHTLTSDGVATALIQVRNLEYLDLSDMPQITGAELATILQQRPKLKHLVLRNSAQFNHQELADALAHVKDHLIFLDLSRNSHLNGEGLSQILEQVPNLEQLDVTDLNQLEDDHLVEALQQVPKLKHLELAFLNRITDDGLSEALGHVPQLTYLDVSSCNQLQRIALPNLTLLATLKAAQAQELTIIVLQNLPALQELDISNNWSLDKEGLKNSLQSVQDTLVKLNLSGLNMNDEQMPDLSGFQNLRHLDLSDNDEITDASLTGLGTLDRVNVLGCDQLSDEAINAVKANKLVQY